MPKKSLKARRDIKHPFGIALPQRMIRWLKEEAKRHHVAVSVLVEEYIAPHMQISAEFEESGHEKRT